jgi:hypothetical protein
VNGSDESIGNKTGIYCSKHKKENMINVKHKMCIENNCNIAASFNFINLKALYCCKHKKENMVDLSNHKICIELNCNTRPNFNLPYETNPLYCSKHKKENMIDIINKRCIEVNCHSVSPAFNFENEKYGIYCSEHKKENMINVKHKRCEHDIFISSCKECGGSDICYHNISKRYCKVCDGSAFCVHDKSKEHCIICSPKIACQNCILEIMSTNKTYRPYCFKCYCVKNPDIEIKRRYKTKEFLLGEALKEMNLTFDFINDKPVNGGCSRKRPDFFFELFTHTVIVECDENGHRDYDTTCEIDKLNATFTDLADRPMIILRFNPDKYNKKSCFDKDCKLIKSEWNKRIKVLKKELKKVIKEIPDELINIKYLFFDKIE